MLRDRRGHRGRFADVEQQSTVAFQGRELRRIGCVRRFAIVEVEAEQLRLGNDGEGAAGLEEFLHDIRRRQHDRFRYALDLVRDQAGVVQALENESCHHALWIDHEIDDRPERAEVIEQPLDLLDQATQKIADGFEDVVRAGRQFDLQQHLDADLTGCLEDAAGIVGEFVEVDAAVDHLHAGRGCRRRRSDRASDRRGCRR